MLSLASGCHYVLAMETHLLSAIWYFSDKVWQVQLHTYTDINDHHMFISFTGHIIEGHSSHTVYHMDHLRMCATIMPDSWLSLIVHLH
jgi:hypothetical protein